MRRGRTGLTAVVLLTALIVVGVFAVTADHNAARATQKQRLSAAVQDPYEVCASNIRSLWRYTYGARCDAEKAPTGQPYSYDDLIIPARSEVDLVIATAPITHSLRIAGLGLTLRDSTKSTVKTSFRTPRAGEMYTGECLAACGRDRQFASTRVTVVTPARYKSWLAAQALAIFNQSKQAAELRAELIQQGVFAPNAPSAR